MSGTRLCLRVFILLAISHCTVSVPPPPLERSGALHSALQPNQASEHPPSNALVSHVHVLYSSSLPASPFYPDRISPSPGTDRCTTIIVGPKASVDGSTMTTHTADCAECDFRLAKVPARDWPAGAQRPIYLFASAYPRRVQEGRSPTWEPANLDSSLPQARAWKRKGFSQIIGHIPQVRHTYALIEGLYGIENEHQVAIGESTCSGRFWTKPRGVPNGGQALLEIGELSSIALERCRTARCAIQTMGDLATRYGYYGAQWDGQMDDIIAEAGEALTVGDPREAWIFHILPDDTGTAAIWAAQRVPDEHLSLVANQFIIRGIPRNHSDDFMHSNNLWRVAEKHRLWSPEDGDLDFLHVYGFLRVHSAYATRRVWRVFTLAAPSLAPSLPATVDDYGDSYPFSVRPDKLLTPQDLMRYQRDHYEGTAYDLTQGVAAGPYGDPNRYDPAANLGENVTLLQAGAGFYERSISLFRTSYSTVTQSRSHLPNLVAARVWICQYMPAMSTYTPLYVASTSLPPSYTQGSLFQYTDTCNYWAAASVGNWATRFYRYIRQDVEAAQRSLEAPLFLDAETSDSQAMALLATGDMEGAREVLAEQAGKAAEVALRTWNDLFRTLIARYRDGYKVKDMQSPVFEQEFLFYPYWWLQVSGFFDHSLQMAEPESLPPSTPTVLPEQGVSAKARGRVKKSVTEKDGAAMAVRSSGRAEGEAGERGAGFTASTVVAAVGFVAGLCTALGFWLGQQWSVRQTYAPLGP